MADKRLAAKDAPQAAEAQRPTRGERDSIYRFIMKGGGEPFGAPFEVGLPSLTERIVKLFKLAGFFGFETVETLRPKNRRNKFTRHGAAPFMGEHQRRKRER